MNESRQPKNIKQRQHIRHVPRRKQTFRQLNTGMIIRLIAFVGMIAVLVLMSMLRKF